MSEEKKVYKLFNLPWYYFAIFSVIVLAATMIGVLPAGMAGCFAFMILKFISLSGEMLSV